MVDRPGTRNGPREPRAIHRKLTLVDFIQARLGDGDDFTLLKRMMVLSFGAGSFNRFWRYWNPVYSYYLGRFCYRPMRSLLPHPLAVVATFACSGFFLHDLPFGWGIRALQTHSLPVPFVALWFAVMAALALASAKLDVDYSMLSFRLRAALNLLNILGAALVTQLIAGT